MNKKEFFKELRLNLKKAYSRLSPSEVDDILRDYSEYFMDGQSEGKDEEEIVESLGDPKHIVDEMVQNDIEDGKYSEEDFAHYFRSKSASDESHAEKGRSVISFIGRGILYIFTVFVDFIYFPAVLLSGIGMFAGGLASVLAFPTVLQIFRIIRQNTFTVIFPVLLLAGFLILDFMITVFLVKLGIKVNKKVFMSKKRHVDYDNMQ